MRILSPAPSSRFEAVSLALTTLLLLASTTHAQALDCDCDSDDALANAAGVLLLAGQAPSSEQLVAAVRDAGSDAVLVHALYLAGADAAHEQKWLTALRAKVDARIACGRAQGEHGSLLIASARGGTLSPLTAASTVVRGKLAPGFSRPELVIADATGKLMRLGLLPKMLEDGVPLALDLPRPAKVQLVAHGSAGPRPVAERVLPSSVPDSERSARPARASMDVDAAGENLQPLLDALRKSRGEHPVRPNRLLAGVAVKHAQAVCREGRLAHQLAPGEDPESRLAQAGVRAKLVGETIARAPDAMAAFEKLQESPSHLLTLLEARFTDAGVGEAKDATGRSCVVVLLAAWPRYVGR